MPLRIIRKRAPAAGNNALQWSIAAATVTRELADITHFPPARAAASLLLLIFDTVQSVQVNRESCERLARRAARLLLDIRDQMAGRWDDAPPVLLKNLAKFEDTLRSIHLYMKFETNASWRDRFLRKGAIEGALAEFNLQLDDAVQSFQIATLINIHYGMSANRDFSYPPPPREAKGQERDDAAPPPYSPISLKTKQSLLIESSDSKECEISHDLVACNPAGANDATPMESAEECLVSPEVCETTIDDDCGFRRFNRTDIVLRGRSRLKEDGWWKDGMEVDIDGRKLLVKRYEGKFAAKHWVRDIKMLQNMHHPSLPQMVGFSQNDVPTPFLVLTNVATKSPQHLLLNVLRTKSLASTAELMLRFYKDISDTALYLRRQLGLTDAELQDFIQDASYRVDDMTIVVGLPPPKEGDWVTMRNYGLTESLRDACLRMLPNRGHLIVADQEEQVTREEQLKINHLISLAQGLLPSSNDPPALSSRVQSLLGDDDDELSVLSLRQIRTSILNCNSHDHSWSERTVPPHKFAGGDLGYIPEGGNFESFVTLKNVPFSIKKSAWGQQWCWEDVPVRRQPIQSYNLPDSVSAWPVAVAPQKQVDMLVVHEASVESVTDAWRYLLENGKSLAEEYSVHPEDLILVTRTGTNQDFYISQFGPLPGFIPHIGAPKPVFPARQGFGQPPSFGHQVSHNLSFSQPPLPKIFYLFTSLDAQHEPYWSQTPVCLPATASRPLLERGYTYRIGWKHGFLNYVQLHREDFL